MSCGSPCGHRLENRHGEALRGAREDEHVGSRQEPNFDALYATDRQRQLHDVVTCIRLGLKLEEAGTRIAANGERYLKTGKEMARLFAAYPEAVAEGTYGMGAGCHIPA